MATVFEVSQVTTLPAELDETTHEKSEDAVIDDVTGKPEGSVSVASVLSDHGEYSEEQYKTLKKKIDRYLLPLMWLCYGIQQTDKTSIGTQATFGLREDNHLVGQQYAWLTTVFYITYLCFEFPSNVVLQRYRMGLILSICMICWGFVVLSIGFAQNFTHLITLRALQGMFECCISPGFILIIGSWYTTREHASRSLVFQSANAGFGIIAQLALYGIGTLQESRGSSFEAWRYMSFFLGSLTTLTGFVCLLLLGTPSEVRWLTPEERRMVNTRILSNNTGHDTTGIKNWKWAQARECLRDPCFYFTGVNAFLSSVPNGGLTTFGSIVMTGFGFSNLQVVLLHIPQYVFSVLYFVAIGQITSRKKDMRLFCMLFSTIPPLIGFLLMAFLPDDDAHRWSKWGGYFMTVVFVITLFMAWTLIPSNTAGRTKRTLTSSFTFVGYCVGNMCGSQIFKSSDAPRYVPGTIGCAVCFGLQFFLIGSWRLVYMSRNRKTRRRLADEGIEEEERIARGQALGEQDVTDFENPYFIYTM